MPTYEGLRLKVLKYDRKILGNVHQRALNKKGFTIISNNCWGGEVYEYYNLQKQSPTVGLFIMAEDYIRFISNLDAYLSSELAFVEPEESKWRDYWENRASRFGTYPIGRLSLEDIGEAIEVFFLHYHSKEDAREKWLRRCERINWDKLIIKFNDQNGCTEEHIQGFLKQNYKHMAFFTCKNWGNLSKQMMTDDRIFYKEIRQFPPSDQIKASFEPFNKEVTNFINEL